MPVLALMHLDLKYLQVVLAKNQKKQVQAKAQTVEE